MNDSHSSRRLWQPSPERINAAHVTRFRARVNERHGLRLTDYQALHRWSVEHREMFWNELWDYAGVRADVRGERVLEHGDRMPGARWFPDARLNFADNLLRRDSPDVAIDFRGEDGESRTLSWHQLAVETAAMARALTDAGVGVGDRVAGFVPNLPEAIVAMLATSSLGATWSSCSPDFGVNGVLDRFGQIEPKVLFTADGYRYNGKVHDSLAVVGELVAQMPSVQRVIIVDHVGQGRAEGRCAELSVRYRSLVDEHCANCDSTGRSAAQLDTVAVPFDHPLYIMFSSGTTGKPKCIVHGAGGTLLQHLKEHQMHVDVHPDERLFFFTTCGWMMWNWLVSGLASEATLLLYDGSPFYPSGNVLFDYASDSNMHYFGTSAKFIDACSKAGIAPRKTHQLPELKSVLSTGSPLVPESFDYVYEQIGSDLCLSSMSGGTDIVSCFVLGNPTLPVVRGELQCAGLGMDVQVFDDHGAPCAANAKGELVCTQAFPCMPIGFYNDPEGKRYHSAYFERFDNVWCHGDYVAMTDQGGMIIYGRSDAVLNPGGVRIGTAEIYRQVESLDEIVESIVIGQRWEGDVRVVLFVKLRDGATLDENLQSRIKRHIRTETTPRHVPARIVAVSDIPRTRSGKIVELAVGKVVHGEPVTNIEALANPEALDLFVDLPELAE